MAVGLDQEIYPNSPLIDVACELRFAAELKVETQRDRFWERIRSQYPDVYVPTAQTGHAPALQHYRFGNSAHSRTVAVALNSLAFSERRYSGHREFIAEFSRIAKIFARCYSQVDHLKRIGWRYTNMIPFQREDGLVPVSRFFKAKVLVPFNLLGSSKNFDARFESKYEGGVVIIRLAVVAHTQLPGVEALLLDLDYAYEEPGLRMRNFGTRIEAARKRCRAIFEELLTPQYRQYLRIGTS